MRWMGVADELTEGTFFTWPSSRLLDPVAFKRLSYKKRVHSAIFLLLLILSLYLKPTNKKPIAKMKAIFAIVLLGLIACATAGILSPYVGYTGYYAASPVVSRVGVVSPYVSSYVSPYVSSYYAGSPVVAPVAYTSGVYSPYAAYSYLLKK